MKKNLKFVIYTLILALFCPVLLFACGEVPFDEVPYIGSDANIEEVVTDFNNSGEKMINGLRLKTQYETTNTYTFYNTQTSTAKTVKDVIKTTLANSNEYKNFTIVETTRYINNVKVTNTTETYVQLTEESETPYCYSSVKTFKEDEETEEKDRNEYFPNIQSQINFYKSTIYEIKQDEVCSIGQKEFEGITYYKLSSGVTTLEAVNNRFVEETENNKLEDNPQLFKIKTKKNHDAAENFYYECARNGSEYTTYFKIHYNLKNSERETYLNVTSVTKLLKFGEDVKLVLPEDENEYIANSFVKTMQKDGSYITYTTTEQNNDGDISNPDENAKVTWTVVKLGDNYSVRRDEYQVGAPSNTTLYYVVHTNENDYTTYVANNNTLTKIDTSLEILDFNFNQSFALKNENTYQFGNEEDSISVTFTDNKVYSAFTYNERNELINIYIEDYGSDYTKLPLTFITSTDGYIVQG